jgi:hypothetical protein
MASPRTEWGQRFLPNGARYLSPPQAAVNLKLTSATPRLAEGERGELAAQQAEATPVAERSYGKPTLGRPHRIRDGRTQ